MTLRILLALLALSSALRAQLKPLDLDRDFFVKLVLKDSSQFYAYIVARPVPDRFVVETRNGRLEIPAKDIAYAVDFRFNFVLRDDMRKTALKNNVDNQSFQVTKWLSKPKLPDISTVKTKEHDIFKGKRYLFDDSAHVILGTPYGNLFFAYPTIEEVENWTGDG